MLQQQLRQRDEDLAARTAEIGELKDRVAQLENLQAQQRQLLSLKDSELAAAQQRLAEVRTAAPAAVPSAATAVQAASDSQTAAQASQPDAPASTSSALPWIWGSLALLGLALLAWLLSRRKSRTPAAPRRSFDSEALAASMVLPLHDGKEEMAARSGFSAEPPAAMVVAPGMPAAAEAVPHVVVDLDKVPTTPAPRMETPAWHSGRWENAAPPPPPPIVAPLTPSFAAADRSAIPAPQASAAQRLKLAMAFVDIGDDTSAREMLRELLDESDPAARTEAARLLRELG